MHLPANFSCWVDDIIVFLLFLFFIFFGVICNLFKEMRKTMKLIFIRVVKS